MTLWRAFEILECSGCEDVSLRQNWRSTEDEEFDQDTGQPFLIDHEEVFPYRVAGRGRLRDAALLPTMVQQIYFETFQALVGHQRILAGIGIGALIEAVCREKSAVGGNLQQRIDWLTANGILSADGARSLHFLREMRNAAAHEIRLYSEDELGIAFDVVEHMLDGVFLLPHRVKRLDPRPDETPF